MTVAIYTTPQIPKSTSMRRKRDLCRRTSSIALSVCKIRFGYETCPSDGRRAKTAVPTYKLETTRAFSIAGEDSPFLNLVRFFFVSFYEQITLSSPLVWFASATTNEGVANGTKSVSRTTAFFLPVA